MSNNIQTVTGRELRNGQYITRGEQVLRLLGFLPSLKGNGRLAVCRESWDGQSFEPIHVEIPHDSQWVKVPHLGFLVPAAEAQAFI